MFVKDQLRMLWKRVVGPNLSYCPTVFPTELMKTNEKPLSEWAVTRSRTKLGLPEYEARLLSAAL
jgi:hypothetical protein